MNETLTKALKRAYSLGQEYWRLADSESYSQNKRAAATEAKFRELIEEAARSFEEERDTLKARVKALEDRLELTATNMAGETVTTDIGECDGISCRDATIKLLEENEARLKAKLAEVKKERDALRKVELPEISTAYNWANTLPPMASQLFTLRMFSHDDNNAFVWAPLAHGLVALINEERGV